MSNEQNRIKELKTQIAEINDSIVKSDDIMSRDRLKRLYNTLVGKLEMYGVGVYDSPTSDRVTFYTL